MPPGRPVIKEPYQRSLIADIEPGIFFAGHPDDLAACHDALRKGLEFWVAAGYDDSNEACVDAIVTFLTAKCPAAAEYLDSKAGFDRAQWWKDFGDRAIGVMAIVALELFLEAS